jgi:hypothetical protein
MCLISVYVFKGEGSAETVNDDGQKASVEGKKDPSLRRRELLLDSGLAEVSFSYFLLLLLVGTCSPN